MTQPHSPDPVQPPTWTTFPLIQALLQRRSRRFGRGMTLNGGPLAYTSATQAQPLTMEEEAALAFAACGITGYALAELPYQSGSLPNAGSGNVITHFIGRTVPSGDAMHMVTMLVMNDEGTWLLKRPQDYPRAEIPALRQAAQEERWVDLYEKSRLRLSDRRVELPREVPFTPPFNKWSANLPGTTYFLPVGELSGLYINILLLAFSEELGYSIVDERNGYRSAGLEKFGRSRGGHLHDRPEEGRVGTAGSVDDWVYEFTAFEHGAMLQNLALMAEAMGLGGFAHFAAHPYGWPQALGFRMEQIPFSRTAGMGPLMSGVLRLLGKDIPVPTAVGLERDGQTLLKPFCPPYYRTMEEAVLALVEYKYAAGKGTFRDGGAATAWKDGAAVQAAIPAYSEKAIAATIAFCEYIYKRYGRIPPSNGPFRTVLAYQAHRLDEGFYEKFYREGAR